MCQNEELDLVAQRRCLGGGCRVWVYPNVTVPPAQSLRGQDLSHRGDIPLTMEHVNGAPFTVTPSAVSEIASLGGILYVSLEGGGCCGRFYAFSTQAPCDLPRADKAAFSFDGVQIVLSHEALEVLHSATIDFSSRIRPPRFRVLRNPNTPDTCPCRRSFGAPWPGRGQATCRSYSPMPWDLEYEPPASWRRQTGWTRDAASPHDTPNS